MTYAVFLEILRPEETEGEGNRMTAQGYVALTPDSLPGRLGALSVLRDRVGPSDSWQVREVGDGNLNLVFIVTGSAGQAVDRKSVV